MLLSNIIQVEKTEMLLDVEFCLEDEDVLLNDASIWLCTCV